MERKIDAILFFSVSLFVTAGLYEFLTFRHLTQLEVKLEEIKKEQDFVKKDLEDFYVLHTQISKNVFVIMDSVVRNMHYTIPHKSKVDGCPECHEYWAHQQKLLRDREEGTVDPNKDNKDEIKANQVELEGKFYIVYGRDTTGQILETKESKYELKFKDTMLWRASKVISPVLLKSPEELVGKKIVVTGSLFTSRSVETNKERKIIQVQKVLILE
jgi:hypothetical protein